jgi:hypothetical protein
VSRALCERPRPIQLRAHLKRAATYNPNGRLSGARKLIIVGNYAYVLTDRALLVVKVSNPARPELIGEVEAPALREPRSIAVQFRYAFVTDADGLKVLDVTDLEQPRAVEEARLSEWQEYYLTLPLIIETAVD